MQLALEIDGWHPGPLFAPPAKRRAPKRRPDDTRAPGRLRRFAERRATPLWADRAATRAAYREAFHLTLDTGITHSVDHIVPLQHPLVCGLHWHGNMRVIPLDENVRKGTRYWPDMPEEQQPLL